MSCRHSYEEYNSKLVIQRTNFIFEHEKYTDVRTLVTSELATGLPLLSLEGQRDRILTMTEFSILGEVLGEMLGFS